MIAAPKSLQEPRLEEIEGTGVSNYIEVQLSILWRFFIAVFAKGSLGDGLVA